MILKALCAGAAIAVLSYGAASAMTHRNAHATHEVLGPYALPAHPIPYAQLSAHLDHSSWGHAKAGLNLQKASMGRHSGNAAHSANPA